MKRKIGKDDNRKKFPIIATPLGVWEEYEGDEGSWDVLGSYTGNPQGEDDYPVQDADDL